MVCKYEDVVVYPTIIPTTSANRETCTTGSDIPTHKVTTWRTALESVPHQPHRHDLEITPVYKRRRTESITQMVCMDVINSNANTDAKRDTRGYISLEILSNILNNPLQLPCINSDKDQAHYRSNNKSTPQAEDIKLEHRSDINTDITYIMQRLDYGARRNVHTLTFSAMHDTLSITDRNNKRTTHSTNRASPPFQRHDAMITATIPLILSLLAPSTTPLTTTRQSIKGDISSFCNAHTNQHNSSSIVSHIMLMIQLLQYSSAIQALTWIQNGYQAYAYAYDTHTLLKTYEIDCTCSHR